MSGSTSVFFRNAKSFFSMPFAAVPVRRAVRRREPVSMCAAAEVLEVRALLSAPSLASAVDIGSTGGDGAFAVAVDTSGNEIMAGSFNGTVDFDPGATHAGDTDILTALGSGDAFVAKYGADGSLLWVQQMGSAAGISTIARSVTTDASGNVYVGGDFRGAISIGPYNLTSSGDKDGFVAKFGSDGSVQWANRWGGVNTEYIQGVAVDGAGNVVVAGSTQPVGSSAYFILQVEKFSPVGTNIWAEQIGNTSGGNANAGGICTDTAGNVFVAGLFRGTVDFDPGARTHNVNGGVLGSTYVLKLAPNGSFGWVSAFISQDSTAQSQSGGLALDGSGNIIVGGYHHGSVDFDPGSRTYTLSGNSGYIVKLNSAGSLVWADQVNGGVVHVAVDTAGNVYGTANNFAVVKFNAAGVNQWTASFASGGINAQAIAVDAAGNVYVVGYFSGTVNFSLDPNNPDFLTSAGGIDMFMLKLNQI